MHLGKRPHCDMRCMISHGGKSAKKRRNMCYCQCRMWDFIQSNKRLKETITLPKKECSSKTLLKRFIARRMITLSPYIPGYIYIPGDNRRKRPKNPYFNAKKRDRRDRRIRFSFSSVPMIFNDDWITNLRKN